MVTASPEGTTIAGVSVETMRVFVSMEGMEELSLTRGAKKAILGLMIWAIYIIIYAMSRIDEKILSLPEDVVHAALYHGANCYQNGISTQLIDSIGRHRSEEERYLSLFGASKKAKELDSYFYQKDPASSATWPHRSASDFLRKVLTLADKEEVVLSRDFFSVLSSGITANWIRQDEELHPSVRA